MICKMIEHFFKNIFLCIAEQVIAKQQVHYLTLLQLEAEAIQYIDMQLL